MTVQKSPPDHHTFIGDELRHCRSGQLAKAADFSHENNILFIHGFTAHGKYMQRLTDYFNESGFNSFEFNYNSYRGIQMAAQTMFDLLSDLNALGGNVIAKHKVSLVCHSMGGLVAKHLVKSFLT